MEQRLRLVQGGYSRSDKRTAERRNLAVPGQIVWKDGRGATRLASVVTRDVSEHGVIGRMPQWRRHPPVSPGLLPGGPRRPTSRRSPGIAAKTERSLRSLPRRPVQSDDRLPFRICAASPRRTRSSGRRGRGRVHHLGGRRQDPHCLTAVLPGTPTHGGVPHFSPASAHLCWIPTTQTGTGGTFERLVTRSPRPVPNSIRGRPPRAYNQSLICKRGFHD